jgi:RimJ/RimL family protein N-acetyltransferase
MGRAVLKLGFDGLGGQEAYVGAWSDNAASLRVMDKLGYRFNGQYLMRRGDACVRDRRMRLSREDWQSDRHADITIGGLPPCLELFGLPAGDSGGDRG